MTLATFLLVAVAATQAVDVPPGSPAEPSASALQSPDTLSAPPLVTTAEECPPSAESDYREGFEALAKRKDRQALEAFERVLAVCPQHASAAELARLARTRLGPKAPRKTPEARPAPAPGAQLAEAALEDGERTTGGARASVAVVQSIHGAAQGILLCAIADCPERGYPTAGLLGASLGLGGALLGTQDGIRPGQAAAINSGTVWGFWFGIASLLAFDLEGDDALGATIVSGAGFTGIGIMVAMLARPTAGQVSMANSGGLWAGVLTALFLATSDRNDTQVFFGAELGATAGGILAFSLLSQTVSVSRGRMLLIDTGGIIGAMAGASIIYSFGGNDSGDAMLVGAGLGALGGLAFTTYLTRNFDGRNVPEVTLAPAVLGRGGTGLALAGRF